MTWGTKGDFYKYIMGDERGLSYIMFLYKDGFVPQKRGVKWFI